MPRTLEQLTIHCGPCGEYIWKNTHSIYNLNTQTEDEIQTETFCAKCEPRMFFMAMKSADKILPLTQNQRDFKE